MPSNARRSKEYKDWDVLKFHVRNRRWWAICSLVDPDEVRRSVRAEEFARLRARRLTTAEREELKAKVSEVQKRLYRKAARLERNGL